MAFLNTLRTVLTVFFFGTLTVADFLAFVNFLATFLTFLACLLACCKTFSWALATAIFFLASVLFFLACLIFLTNFLTIVVLWAFLAFFNAATLSLMTA